MTLLSVGNLCLLGAAYVVGSILYQVLHYRFFHPLSKFPGNFWGSVTRLWITYHNVQEDECATFQKLHEQHGTSIPSHLPPRFAAPRRGWSDELKCMCVCVYARSV